MAHSLSLSVLYEYTNPPEVGYDPERMNPRKSVTHRLRWTLRLTLALRLVWQSARYWTVANLLLIVAQSPLPLLSLYLMKQVIDTITAGFATTERGRVFHEAAVLIVLIGAITLISTLLGSLAKLVNEVQTQKVTNHVHNILHAKSLEVDLEYYENAQYYDTLHRAQQEAAFRPTDVLNNLIQLSQNGLSLLIISSLLYAFHWSVPLILLIAVLPDVFVRLRYADKMYHWQREHTSIERQSWYFNWMLTRDTHAKEIRLFDLGALFMRRFRDLRDRLLGERLRIAAQRSVLDVLAQAGAVVVIFGSYAFIAYRTVYGIFTIGDLVMYYQAFQRGQNFLQGILSSLSGLYEDNLFLSHLQEFLALQRKVAEPSAPQIIPRPMRTGIVFEHVSFRYPASNRKVLEDITLQIRPGEKVAFVGKNGAGKTTLIKLLCRLYDPTSGAITFDGIDLRDFETTALRREISILFQDYVHYNVTARENIWFGNLAYAPEHAKIVEAARYSGADDVIAGLPQGYDTVLGKWLANGEELSVGEWQKIALARAFLRDAQIIVLDEPTSAMDAKSEYDVFQTFRDLAKERTAILISHRFSTVRMADRIYVLDQGTILESGTHAELLRLNGMYARLFDMQAQSYRDAPL